MKLTQGGVFVSAIIYRPCPIEMHPETFQWIDRYPHLAAEVNGRPADVNRVWTSGEGIDEAEYLYLMDDREHARRHRPDSPEANPHQAIDFDTLAPPQF